MIVTKTLRYRLEPNWLQRQLFARFAGCCRFVFNHGLDARRVAYENNRQRLSFADQCKALTQLKRAEETRWLKDVHSQVLQQALADLQTAYEHFFRRMRAGEAPGFPKFKKKGRKDSFRYPQGVRVDQGKVFLPKIGWVKYRDSRPVNGTILQATIKREGDHWFIALACKLEVAEPAKRKPTPDRAVGIDVGLKKFALLSDGTEIENPRFLEGALPRLRRAQRKLSRKELRSKNWWKQVRRVVQLHIKVKNSRRDFAQKLSTTIVKNHDVIAVEDLHIRGLLRNRRLSRAVSDAGWGMFLEMLEYKSRWAGKHFVKIGRYVATSQICSRCGERKPMPLSARTYTCGECGATIDRDWNASINIRAAGLAVLNACGGA